MREARLIPIVFKILSSGLALLVIVGSVGCSQNRHLQIDEPFRGLHHSLAESESGSLRILLVHGIGCHEPGYSDPVQRGITERLGLREIASRRTMIELAPQSREIQSWQRGNYVEPVKKDTLCKASDQPPALLSRTYQGGGQEVTFIEVTWSPISEALKDRELADEYLPAQRRRRALLNHWLKTSLVNDRLADAVVYLGQAQRDIQWVVQQGLCWMALEVSFDMTRHKALCSTRDRLQPRPDHFAIITESLGSRIVFDTLWSPDLKLTDLELLPRIGGVYMLANQLPLLELASDGKEAARVVERVSRRKFDDRLTDWLNELSERTDRTPTSLCVGGMEALEGDREAWEETVERQLDPRHRAQRVVRAENVHADRVAYHRRLVDERTEVAVRSSRTPSELNRLGGELSERERQLEAFDAVAERKANELARAEAAREQERRKHEAVEGTQQRLRQLQQLHRALSGELASELLSAATSLTEIIRLESRLVEFQKAALVVRTGLELNQTWLQGLDTVRRNIRHENDLLVDALTVARGHLEELRDNQAQASLECTKECKDTLEELAKAVRDYRALYAKLDLKNSKLVRTREQLAEATSTAKELDQAGALARFAAAKRDVERLSDSVDEAKELRRRMKVELEILRKRHDELQSRHHADRDLMEDLDNRIEAAERDIVSAENELRLARAESEARALRGQYAFRLLVYKAPSLRFKAENDLLDELIAERADSPNPADQAATSCLKQLREDLDPPPAADEYRRFVALNDPNDLLGYSIPKRLAEPYAALFSNVSLRLSTQFFGLAANPLVAHSGHERNPLALQLMTCGTVENDKKRGTRYVPRRCHPTAEPVLTDSESQLQTAALRGE